MHNTCRLVVFDWEGTLADTLGHVLHLIRNEAALMGLENENMDNARSFVDLGLNKAIQKLFPMASYLQQNQLMESVQKAMLTQTGEVQLLPGAKECIEKLHKTGMLLAVASNKGQQSLQRAIVSAGLESFFTITRSAGQTAPKPNPQMLLEILDFCQIPSEDALMIGDSESDMEMAHFAGVEAIGVDFYRQQSLMLKMAGAKIVFDDYSELTQYLMSVIGVEKE